MILYDNIPDISIEYLMRENGIPVFLNESHSLKEFCKYCIEGFSFNSWARRFKVPNPQKFVSTIVIPYLKEHNAFTHSISDKIKIAGIYPPALTLRKMFISDEELNEKNIEDMTVAEIGEFYFNEDGKLISPVELRFDRAKISIIQYYNYAKKCSDMSPKQLKRIETTLISHGVIPQNLAENTSKTEALTVEQEDCSEFE